MRLAIDDLGLMFNVRNSNTAFLSTILRIRCFILVLIAAMREMYFYFGLNKRVGESKREYVCSILSTSLMADRRGDVCVEFVWGVIR